MNHKRKTLYAQLGVIYPSAFSVIIVENPVGDAALAGGALASCVWMAALIIKGDPEARRQREKELHAQRTRELEKDLGLEPLNLHELDPLFDDIEKEKPRE